MIMKNLKNEILLLSEVITHGLLREQGIVSSLARATDYHGAQISTEFLTALEKVYASLSIGKSVKDAFAEIEYFNQELLRSWVQLIETSYSQPNQAKALWLESIKGSPTPDIFDGRHLLFLQTCLKADHTLWIAGENRSSVDSVVARLKDSTSANVSIVALEENRESLALLCKRDKLQPNKSQIVLWIDTDLQNKTVLSGIDEIHRRLPGRMDYSVASLYILKYGHHLVPTGVVPTIYESLQQKSSISRDLFLPAA
jgi:hypothetical protein